MLDYILSKMVLMVFLLLLVSAFIIVRDALSSYFIQRGAMNIVREICERLTTISTSKYVKSEKTVYVLPPFIEGGGQRIPYEVNVACVTLDGTKYLVFSVIDRKGNVLAYDGVALPASEVYIGGFPAQSTAEASARRFIVMSKSVVGNGVRVVVCASNTKSCKATHPC